MKPTIITKLPGPKSTPLLNKYTKLNGAASTPYPYVHSNQGDGCYFKDIDNNIFLDFGSQIASNPLGYNHKDLKNIPLKFKTSPIKYAGQDFATKEHINFLENLIKITPKNLNSAILLNSGAEAVENSIKVAMRNRPNTKFGISFNGAFHGRTLGALSLTHSKSVYTKNYLKIPTKILDYNLNAIEQLQNIIKKDSSESIGFIIMEMIQGEGGYNVADKNLVKEIRKITKNNNIPFIVDEVQSGLARTGKWWAFQNYNITPDIFSAAKALQVGATISNKKTFPTEPGAISSTWGGGHTIDLSIGLQTINTIKKDKLMVNINKQGKYLTKSLNQINLKNVRGIGLMQAFDLKDKPTRDNLIIQCLKQGLVLLGAGHASVRIIPPYIVQKQQIDQAISIIESALKQINKPKFTHKGQICGYLSCGSTTS